MLQLHLPHYDRVTTCTSTQTFSRTMKIQMFTKNTSRTLENGSQGLREEFAFRALYQVCFTLQPPNANQFLFASKRIPANSAQAGVEKSSPYSLRPTHMSRLRNSLRTHAHADLQTAIASLWPD